MRSAIPTSGGTGASVTVEDLGAEGKIQVTKIAWGPENSATDVDNGAGLPVRPQPSAAGGATPSHSRVAAVAVDDTTLLAANGAALERMFYLEPGSSSLYLRVGTGASLTAYTVILDDTNPSFSTPHTCRISGRFNGATGGVQITEVAA